MSKWIKTGLILGPMLFSLLVQSIAVFRLLFVLQSRKFKMRNLLYIGITFSLNHTFKYFFIHLKCGSQYGDTTHSE